MDRDIELCRNIAESAQGFRPLTEDEIHALQTHNTAKDWNSVYVSSSTDKGITGIAADRIRNCHFNGKVFLGTFDGPDLELDDDITLPVGLYNSSFSGICILCNDCLVKNTNVVCNTMLHSRAVIIGCDIITSNKEGSTYGRQQCVTVGSGRCIPIDTSLSYPAACDFALRPQNPKMVAVLQSHMNIISSDAVLRNSNLTSCYVGHCASIVSSNLSHTTVLSTPAQATTIARSTTDRSIVHAACHLKDAALSTSLLYSSACVTRATVENSILAPDSSIALGDCSYSIVGPFIGFHHSSLLIAALWLEGRGNIAYGAMVGANHTGRCNDQEAHLGEGVFFGLGVKMKFPLHCIESPYSIFAAGVTCLPQAIAMPFSLIVSPDAVVNGVSPAFNVIKPGWILYDNIYMPERCLRKYRSRRKSPVLHTDTLPVFRPRIIRMMQKARQQLHLLLKRPQDIYREQDCDSIGKNILYFTDAQRGVDAYTMYIRRYALLHGLLPVLMTHKKLITSLHMPVSELVKYYSADFVSSCTISDDIKAMEEDQSVLQERINVHAWSLLLEEYEVLSENGPSIDELLSQTISITNKHCKNVVSCRKKDASRGKRVIPDYEDVCVAPEQDAVVEDVQKSCQVVLDNVESLRVFFENNSSK